MTANFARLPAPSRSPSSAHHIHSPCPHYPFRLLTVSELQLAIASGAVKFEKRTPAAQTEGRVHTVQHVQSTGFSGGN